MNKVCCKCKISKDIKEFWKNCKSKDGFQYKCKNCHRKSTNKDKARNNKLQKSYSITLDQYNIWNEAFDKVCHICENKCPSGRNLAVDHNHENGLVRGLLCINCNKGLGNFKDNKELLYKAIQYLKESKEIEEHVKYAINKESNQISFQ